MDINDAWLLFKQGIIDKYFHTYKLKERKNLYTTPEVFNLKRKKNKLWKSIVQLTFNITLIKPVNDELRM